MREVYIKGCDPAPELEHASPEAEIWGLNSQRKNPPPRATRWFQLHGLGHMLERHGPEYFEYLTTLNIPLYLFESQIARWDEFMRENNINVRPMSRWVDIYTFPEERTCLPEFGGNYKTNTIDWLMALAMAWSYDRIHLVGLDYSTEQLWKSRRKAADLIEGNPYPLHEEKQIIADLRGVCTGSIAGDESWARTSIEYYVGLAQGRGIEVTWNEGSGLFVNHHGGRYGLDCAGNE